MIEEETGVLKARLSLDFNLWVIWNKKQAPFKKLIQICVLK